ncbi:MAG TPA: diheme cytochrome c-553 [Chitinophagaceae bacterium]
MKKIALMMSALAVVTTFVVIACNQEKTKNPAKETLTGEALVKRGEYLVSAVGCDDCHSPKIFKPEGGFDIDMTRRFSGHPSEVPVGKVDTNTYNNGWIYFANDLTAYAGPWGISYAANISSDSTGIGMWSEEQFIRALRKGLYKGLEGSRPLLPPMPWFVYRNFNDQDLKAIFAYLKSTKPIKNLVPQWQKPGTF